MQDDESETPNPEAVAKPSKPTVHGPWYDIEGNEKEGQPGSHHPPVGSPQKECSPSRNLKRHWTEIDLGDLARESRSEFQFALCAILANQNQALLSKLTQRNSNLIVLAVLTASGG
jgi:hypothetical protein